METIEQRALTWLLSSDTGASSKSLARHMLGTKHEGGYVSAPWDGDDLGRCLRLLAKIPEWEARIGEMAALSHMWAALVPHWAELKALMAEEAGADFRRDARTPKTTARMKTILDGADKADGWVSLGKNASVRMKF